MEIFKTFSDQPDFSDELQLDRYKERDTRSDELDMLNKTIAKIEGAMDTPAEIAGDDRPASKMSMARTIRVQAGIRVNQHKLQRLAALFNEEQRTADIWSDNRNHPKDAESYRRAAFERTAFRTQLAEDTDVRSKLLGLVDPGLNETQWSRARETLQLFEEFFAVCQLPNRAEIDFLARKVGLDREYVIAWFARKRERVTIPFVLKSVRLTDPGTMEERMQTSSLLPKNEQQNLLSLTGLPSLE